MGNEIIEISLSAARENAGYTLEEVATKLKRSKNTIAKYEKDSSKIPSHLLAALSELYRIPTDYIFLGNKYDLIRTIRSKQPA
ncbi:helix-turn-helix domain-containing protein [Carnobacterium maltaromaticum]|uniref:helix-turn-helix domain-containing protein n=1 Tax=Carnobacterium maltaromaticum TaxID=2751 RepID=UPI0038FC2B67